jgi:uncharacterized caspase-like protein
MRRMAAFACAVMLLCVGVSPSHADKRVALVVGNAAYKSTAALANPGNDAEDMAAALRRVGFAVVLARNLDKRGMDQAVADFGRAAQDADAALFYYAGHGMQYRGLNYLMPVDARLEDQFSLNSEMTRLDDVLSSLDQTHGVKILVLDACRRNPLADRLATTRDFAANRGLARLGPTNGMVVAYATQPDQLAADGSGRNSPFTAALIKEINEPGLEIGTMFRRVSVEVNKRTAGRQTPEISFSLLSEFYFSRADSDMQAWTKVRGSQDKTQLGDFLSRYPSSPLAADIRERLDAIERTERERTTREQAERERLDRERLARQQAERDQAEEQRLERERVAREQADRERLDRERLTHEQAERDQAENQRLERERVAREQAGRERLAQEEAERIARAEKERARQEAPANPQTPAQLAALERPSKPLDVAPTSTPPLMGGKLIEEIKKELKRAGCYGGRIDDKWPTAEMKPSVEKFVKYAKIPPQNAEPAIELLNSIREKPVRVCPLECSPRQVEKDGHCVAKTCPSGQQLTSGGDCAAKPEKTVSRPEVPATGSSHAAGVNSDTQCHGDKDCLKARLVYIRDHPLSACNQKCQSKCNYDKACIASWAPTNAETFRQRAAAKGVVLR